MDSSIVSFIPRGSYYNTKEEQFAAYSKQLDELFKDRSLFDLIAILPGTDFSKGLFAYWMLAQTQTTDEKNALMELGLPGGEVERRIILWNLKRMSTPRALKNLLMLTGKIGRVNNARTRRIILDYIFDRDDNSLENLAIKYRRKLAALIRHALGKQTLYQVLEYGFISKKMVRYLDNDRVGLLGFIFGRGTEALKKLDYAKWPVVYKYTFLRNEAKNKRIEPFIKKCANFPFEVALGFRNTYKLNIPLAELHERCSKTAAQKVQQVRSSERAGADVKIDLSKYDIYELYKLFFTKEQNKEDTLDVMMAIGKQSEKKLDIDLGSVAVVWDCSASMAGSKERPLHPHLTAHSLLGKVPNIKAIYRHGGEQFGFAVMPSGDSSLWKEMDSALKDDVDTVLIISDGYENNLQGLAEHIYRKNSNSKRMLHVNPVYASEVSGMRRLISNIEPIPLQDYKALKTGIIFTQLSKEPELVKKMLVADYKRLIEEEKKE